MTVAYGMTEAPTIVTRTDADSEPQEELCGRAVEQVEILIVDDRDQPLPQGEIGEICVQARRARTLRPRVHHDARATGTGPRPRRPRCAAVCTTPAISASWMQTGQLFIRGRQNDLIIRGGANVYPAEVERVLASHPAVAGGRGAGRAG